MNGNGGTLLEVPGLSVEAERNGDGTAIMRLRGELDIVSAEAAQSMLDQLPADIRSIVLDLGDVTFCDAAGSKFLLAAREQADATRGSLVVSSLSAPMRRVLALTGDLPAVCPSPQACQPSG